MDHATLPDAWMWEWDKPEDQCQKQTKDNDDLSLGRRVPDTGR